MRIAPFSPTRPQFAHNRLSSRRPGANLARSQSVVGRLRIMGIRPDVAWEGRKAASADQIDEQGDVEDGDEGGEGDDRGGEPAVHVFPVRQDHGVEARRHGGADQHHDAG